MFEHYTEDARRTIFFARWEAHRRGLKSIDSLHILLGISQDRKNRVNELFFLRDWYVRIAEQHCPFPKPLSSDQADLPLNGIVRQILRNMVNPAEPPQWIDTGDLLLALLREKNCLAGQVLSEIAFDEESVKEKLALYPRNYGPLPVVTSDAVSELQIRRSRRSLTTTEKLGIILLLIMLIWTILRAFSLIS